VELWPGAIAATIPAEPEPSGVPQRHRRPLLWRIGV